MPEGPKMIPVEEFLKTESEKNAVTHIVFHIRNINSMIKQLQDRGINIKYKLGDTFGDEVEIHLDPNGVTNG